MKPPPSQEVILVLPGEQAWELWKWAGDKPPERVAVEPAPAALHPPPSAVLGLPVSEVSAAAVWLATTDEKLIPEMATLQSESLFREEGAPFGYRILRQEEARSLVSIAASSSAPPALEGIAILAACVPAFAAFQFEENTLTVLRELGSLVVVAASADGVLGAMRLGSDSLDRAAAGEVACFAMNLVGGEAFSSPPRVILWGEAGDAGFEQALQTFQMACDCVPRPLPSLPTRELDLMPPRFREAARRQSLFKKVRVGATVAAAACLAMLLLFVGRYLWLEIECHSLEARNATLRPEANALRAAADHWRSLAPAVDRDQFAVEWLHQFASRLPDKGLRLTSFEWSPEAVSVVGEADTAAQVVQYQDALAGAPALVALHLAMPPPKIQPNNFARFEITGSTEGKETDETP